MIHAVRVAHVCLHPAQAEDDSPVTLAGKILGGIQRFLQRDAEAALEQHRKIGLAADGLEQFEVLGVGRKCNNITFD